MLAKTALGNPPPTTTPAPPHSGFIVDFTKLVDSMVEEVHKIVIPQRQYPPPPRVVALRPVAQFPPPSPPPFNPQHYHVIDESPRPRPTPSRRWPDVPLLTVATSTTTAAPATTAATTFSSTTEATLTSKPRGRNRASRRRYKPPPLKPVCWLCVPQSCG